MSGYLGMYFEMFIFWGCTMSSIIIKDASTGQSKSFVPTREGYAEAAAYRDSIVQQGHTVASQDLGRIESVTGSGGLFGLTGGSNNNSNIW